MAKDILLIYTIRIIWLKDILLTNTIKIIWLKDILLTNTIRMIWPISKKKSFLQLKKIVLWAHC